MAFRLADCSSQPGRLPPPRGGAVFQCSSSLPVTQPEAGTVTRPRPGPPTLNYSVERGCSMELMPCSVAK
eukprot:348319-Rhodomonas_salina.1